MELAGLVLCAVGAVFFFAGTVGLIRFPDSYSRFHALTKADNLGLGFVVLGLALASQSWLVAGKLFLIWVITTLGGTTNCYLIGNTLFTRSQTPHSDGGDT